MRNFNGFYMDSDSIHRPIIIIWFWFWQGEKIRAELLSLVAELPAFYESLTTDVKSLSDVVDFYGAFVQFTIER